MSEGRIIHVRETKVLKHCPELLCSHAPEQWSQWESCKIWWSPSRKKVMTVNQTLLNVFCGHLGSFVAWRRQSPACRKGGMCGGSYPLPVGNRRLCMSWSNCAAVKSRASLDPHKHHVASHSPHPYSTILTSRWRFPGSVWPLLVL